MDYNVIVIGAGSGGLVSAYISAILKAKVALIEKHKMGGDCLNTGCVPSKALIRSTTLLSMIRRHKEFGIAKASADYDFAEIMERVQRVIRKVAPHDSIERYSAAGVNCIEGEAKILSPHEVRVNGKVLTTKNIILATGANPFIPPIPGLDKVDFLHTDNLWELREQPKRLVVLGGGPIGSEMTQCFTRLGTKVIQVEKAPQLLTREDDEIIKIVQGQFEKEGVELHVNSTAKEVIVRGGKNFLKVEKSGGETFEIEFDRILVAVGRRPFVKGFGLEELGVKLTPRGAIETDAYARTNIKNIFACGDCTSVYQFTHMAAHQAWYCVVNALFRPFVKRKVDMSTIPWCTFTDPEVARIGMNEKDAKVRNIPYEVVTYPINDLDRAIADEEDHGLVKVITIPGKDRFLGVTICGYHAGDILPEFIFAKKYGFGLREISGVIHTYPTMGEANKYAATAWKKMHVPKGLLNLIGGFHRFRR